MGEETEVTPDPTFNSYGNIHHIKNKSYRACIFPDAKKAEGAPVFVGFPNIGITPVLALNFLTQDLDLPLIGTIREQATPTVAVVNSKGQPGPAIRIFGNEKLIIIGSEMKAEGNMKHLLDTIVAVIKHLKSNLIWCVEGVGVEKIERIDRSKLKYMTSSEELAKRFQEMGHTPFHNAMLAGITGGLIAETSVSAGDFDIACLLVPSSSLYPDAMSSVVAIKVMAEIQQWKSDPKELESSAKQVEEKVQELIGSSLRKSGSGWSSMYQ